MDRIFVSTHNDWNARQELVFVLPGGESEDSYKEAMWAVHIEAVLVDGEQVPAGPFTGSLDDLDFRRVSTQREAFMVRTLMGKVVTAARFESETSFDLVTHSIPMTAGLIEIRYRPRYWPGVLTGECRLVSTQV